MSNSKSLRTIFAMFVVLMLGVMNLFTGFRTLFLSHPKDIRTFGKEASQNVIYKGTPDNFSSELFHMKHTVNGFIPTGTEYYYLALCEDTKTIYLIRADKNWYDKVDGAEDIVIEGKSRALTYKVKQALLSEIDSELLDTYQVQDVLFIDLTYKKIAVLRLVSGIIILIAAICMIISHFNEELKEKIPTALKVIGGVLVGISVLMLLYVLNVDSLF